MTSLPTPKSKGKIWAAIPPFRVKHAGQTGGKDPHPGPPEERPWDSQAAVPILGQTHAHLSRKANLATASPPAFLREKQGGSSQKCLGECWHQPKEGAPGTSRARESTISPPLSHTIRGGPGVEVSIPASFAPMDMGASSPSCSPPLFNACVDRDVSCVRTTRP